MLSSRDCPWCRTRLSREVTDACPTCGRALRDESGNELREIDLVYDRLGPKTRARLDVVTFVFFLLYVGTLVWVGGQMAWDSFNQGETTGTPWNPLIWPVKMAIPLAGFLLLLQGIANLLREIGLVEKKS